MIAAWFLVPAAWPWLLLLPAAVGLGLWRARARRRAVDAVLGARATALAGRPVFARTRALLAVGAAAGAALALLRPQAGTPDAGLAVPDLVVALDTSWSMAAQDQPPSRLAAAVAAVRALGARAGRLRLGLVVFAGEARLAVPLTQDVDAVADLAGGLVAGAELRGGTDLGAAIDVARTALERAGSGSGDIVVLTDGEDFGGAGALAAGAALRRGFPVHVVGYGTAAGSKIAVETGGGQEFLRDDSGQDVVVALEPQAIAAVAAAGGGEALIDVGAEALVGLHDDRLLPRAERARRASATGEFAHAYQWPLAAALLLWMLRFVLPERRR